MVPIFNTTAKAVDGMNVASVHRATALDHHNCLTTFSADAACQLNILWHDGDMLGMDSAQVCVLKQTHHISLSGFLKTKKSRSLEAEITLEVCSPLTDETPECKPVDE